MAGVACIFLGYAASPDSLQAEFSQPSAPYNSKIKPHTNHDEGYWPLELRAGKALQVGPQLARLGCTSPWLYIMFKLLTGYSYYRKEQWVYPFKHLMVYEGYIKKAVQVMNDIDVDALKTKDLLPTLRHIAGEVMRNIGPGQSDLQQSDDDISEILRQESHGTLRAHFDKVDYVSAQKKENYSSAQGSDAKSVDLGCTCLRDARDQLQLLVNVIDKHLTSLSTLRRAISDHSLKKISFRDLWHLFQPGDLVVSSRQPIQAYRVLLASGGRPLLTKDVLYDNMEKFEHQDKNRNSKVSPFRVDCIRLDFDGERFGPVHETISIFEYDGIRQVVDLDVYPIVFSDDEMALRDKLSKRGHDFATYRDFKHKRYTGLSIGDLQDEVRRRRAVDFIHYNKTNRYIADRKRGDHRLYPSLSTSRLCSG